MIHSGLGSFGVHFPPFLIVIHSRGRQEMWVKKKGGCHATMVYGQIQTRDMVVTWNMVPPVHHDALNDTQLFLPIKLGELDNLTLPYSFSAE